MKFQPVMRNAEGRKAIPFILSGGMVATNWDVAAVILSAVGVLLLVWELWGRPWRKQLMLRDPCRVDIVIPKKSVFDLGYIEQFEDEYKVNSLTLPPYSECIIQFCLVPRGSFHHSKTIFQFYGDGSVPIVTDQRNLLYPDPAIGRLPGSRTIHKAYELQPETSRVKGSPFDHGFVVKTQGEGEFEAFLYLVVEDRQIYYPFPVSVQAQAH